MGGHLGDDHSFGRKARGVKVLGNELGPYVETLVRRYLVAKREGDTFATFVNRLDDQELATFAAKPKFSNLPPAPTAIAEPRAS